MLTWTQEVFIIKPNLKPFFIFTILIVLLSNFALAFDLSSIKMALSFNTTSVPNSTRVRDLTGTSNYQNVFVFVNQTEAVINTSVYYDGSHDDKLKVLNEYSWSGDFSIGCWVKYDKTLQSGAQTIDYFIQEGNTGSGGGLEGFGIYNLRSTGNVVFRIKDTAGTISDITVSQPNYEWVHWVGTFKTSNDTSTLYTNGTYEGSSTTALGTVEHDSGAYMIIGNDDDDLKERSLEGYIDECFFFDRYLTAQEVNDIFTNNTNGYGYPWNSTIPSPPTNITFEFNTTYPSNASQFNKSLVTFNATIIHLLNQTYNYNCSLDVDNLKVRNWTNINLTFINFSYNLGVGQHNYSFNCYDNVTNATSTRTIIYVDFVFPIIYTTFVNNSIYFEKNLTTFFNFTDDFYLNSFNISIDGSNIVGYNNLTGKSFTYNFNFKISNLSLGKHNMTVKLADGHTAKKIKDYKVSKGLFGNKLKYEWETANYKTKSVTITNKDGSLLDIFDTKKEFDRYTWDFYPYEKKSTYTFEIETDEPIRIIEDNNTYLGSWITFGNKWIDFDVENEDEKIKISRVNNKKVSVKISNIQNPDKIKFKSIGDLNVIYVNYSFYKINASVTYQPIIFEGSYSPFNLNIYGKDIIYYNNSAYLLWHNKTVNATQNNISTDHQRYNSTVLATNVNSSFVNWTFYFNISGFLFNISNQSEFVEMNITNCSSSSYIVLNYTLYDEETLIKPTGVNSTIDTFLTLTIPSMSQPSYNFSIKTNNTNLLICLPNSTLNFTNFTLYAITNYYYDDHVKEFHYIENFSLTKDVIPKVIHLRDLLSTDSTNFIVTYQDENYLYVEDVIIDLLRQYIDQSGAFKSVEHGKTDEGGQTNLHFVTNDVIYKANVWYKGVLQYQTNEFQALCQASPCQINLRKPYNESDQISKFDNLIYDITTQDNFYSTKTITFNFATKDLTPVKINMSVTQSTNSFNTTICSNSQTLSSGSLVCVIPIAYHNSTYTTRIYKDNEFIGWKTYNSNPNAEDVFGSTGVFLGSIGYLTLALMGLSSATASIILGIIGLILMSLMNLIIGGSVFGIGSSIIWIIIAGGILIYKYQNRRVQ